MDTILIRKGFLLDIDHIAHLCIQLGYTYPIDKVKKNFNIISNLKDHAIFVAVHNDKVVGWIHVHIYNILYSDTLVNILGIVVEEGYRNKGIGKKLIKAAEDWGVENNCAGVRVHSAEHRKEAHKFYENLGYQFIKKHYNFRKVFD